jgi:hypothetical protein
LAKVLQESLLDDYVEGEDNMSVAVEYKQVHMMRTDYQYIEAAFDCDDYGLDNLQLVALD